MYLKSPDSEENNPYLQQVLDELWATASSETSKVIGDPNADPDVDKIKEACLRALERLGQSQEESYREMAPAYEVTYNPDTGEALCSFYMDVPYVEARVTLLKPENQTKEEFDQFVEDIIAGINLDFSEY